MSDEWVYFFPHSRDEFADAEELREFLQGLLGDERKGQYLVVTARLHRREQPGELIVFHKDRQLVGEARVKRRLRLFDPPQRFGKHKYEGCITFDPDTIRVYPTPVTFEQVEERAGVKVNSRPPHRLSSDAYESIMG